MEQEKTKTIVIEKQVSEKWSNSAYVKAGITVFITFACCILFFFVIFRFTGFAGVWKKFFKSGESIIMGLVLAYLLNPVMKFISKHSERILRRCIKKEKKRKKLAKGIGVIGAIAFLIILLALLLAAIVPSIIDSVNTLVETMSSSVSSFLKLLDNKEFLDDDIADYLELGITNITDYLQDWAKNTLLPQAQTYVSHITTITSSVISVVKSLLNFVIGIIVAVYVMSIQDTLKGQCKKIIYAVMKPHNGNLLIEIVRESNRIFGGFITGKLLDSAIIGVICYIGCCILRMPYALLVSVIVGVTNVIPFFGPIIGAVPCLFLVVIQSPLHALYLLIFIIVLQQVDGNIIGPKILGDSTGLSSFWIMFAILIGGGMFGFMGMLLGVPVFGVIYYLVRRVINYRVRKKDLSDRTQDYILLDYVDEKTNTIVFMKEKNEESPEEEDTEAENTEVSDTEVEVTEEEDTEVSDTEVSDTEDSNS